MVVEVALLDVVNTEDEAVDVAIWRRMSRGCGKTVVMQGYKGAFKKLLLGKFRQMFALWFASIYSYIFTLFISHKITNL